MNNNPGVGLQMTSRRSIIHVNKMDETPGPQSYDVEFKLTDREKRQNELLSRRYVNWKKESSGAALGGGITSGTNYNINNNGNNNDHINNHDHKSTERKKLAQLVLELDTSKKDYK